MWISEDRKQVKRCKLRQLLSNIGIAARMCFGLYLFVGIYALPMVGTWSSDSNIDAYLFKDLGIEFGMQTIIGRIDHNNNVSQTILFRRFFCTDLIF